MSDRPDPHPRPARRPLERFRASADELQTLVPKRPRGQADVRGWPLSIHSGVAGRSGFLRSNTDGLAGFRFDVPAPDPSLTCLWATISFDWQFYDWSSNLLTNPTDHNIHVNGSLVWIWFLTGHPQIFPNAPEFLTDGALFSFETFVVPGTNGGWDAAWLAPAKSGTFSSVPDKIDDSGSSPLSRLLAMDQNGVLRLWFAMDFRNPQVNEAGLSGSHGWTIDGGPDTLYYTYAYSSPRLIDLSYTYAYSSPRLIDLSPREPLLVG